MEDLLKRLEELSYALGESVGFLKGIEQNCHDKFLKYEIRKAIEKITKTLENGSNIKV